MRLESYPRPPNDTGIGFHYYMDSHHFGDDDASLWIPELKDMGASWLTLIADFGTLIPEAFIVGLVENEIEPVVRIRTPKIRPLEQPQLMRELRAYAGAGVHYVHVFNEPNIAGEWAVEDWSKPNLVERFVDILIPCLERMNDAGLIPLFTPLSQGGHYWDTTFLDSALERIVAKGKRHLFDRMAVCIHNYASNRPLIWGKGGRAKWPAARPYNCPQGCQDQNGFYLCEWYDEIVRARVGHSLPLICGENGLVIGTRNHPAYPTVDEMMHAQRVVEMTRMLMSGELPDYLFNNAFWVIAADEAGETDAGSFYRIDGSRTPAVEALKTLQKHPRVFSWDGLAGLAPKSRVDSKPIYHYVLLGSSSTDVDQELLQAIAPYVSSFAPTVGFNVDEAKLASRVTIVGDDLVVPANADKELRAAGCIVERVDCHSSREARRIFGGMVRRSKRFYYLVE